MHQIRYIQSCSLPGYCSWFADSSYGRSQGMTQSCQVVLGPDFAAGNNVEVARAWEGQARGFSCPFVLGVQLTFIFHAAGSCFSVLRGDEDFREGWALLQVLMLMLPCIWVRKSLQLLSHWERRYKANAANADAVPIFPLWLLVLWLPSFVLVVLVSFPLIFRPHKYLNYTSCWKLSFPLPGNIDVIYQLWGDHSTFACCKVAALKELRIAVISSSIYTSTRLQIQWQRLHSFYGCRWRCVRSPLLESALKTLQQAEVWQDGHSKFAVSFAGWPGWGHRSINKNSSMRL